MLRKSQRLATQRFVKMLELKCWDDIMQQFHLQLISETSKSLSVCSPLLILTDIQEFYELTLMDGSKSITQKTLETLEVANRWENRNFTNQQQPQGEVRKTCHLSLFVIP